MCQITCQLWNMDFNFTSDLFAHLSSSQSTSGTCTSTSSHSLYIVCFFSFEITVRLFSCVTALFRVLLVYKEKSLLYRIKTIS
jgi:hypothetical protein